MTGQKGVITTRPGSGNRIIATQPDCHRLCNVSICSWDRVQFTLYRNLLSDEQVAMCTMQLEDAKYQTAIG